MNFRYRWKQKSKKIENRDKQAQNTMRALLKANTFIEKMLCENSDLCLIVRPSSGSFRSFRWTLIFIYVCHFDMVMMMKTETKQTQTPRSWSWQYSVYTKHGCTQTMATHPHTHTHQMPNDMCLICVAKNHKYTVHANNQPDWCTFCKSMKNHTLSAPDKHLSWALLVAFVSFCFWIYHFDAHSLRCDRPYRWMRNHECKMWIYLHKRAISA